MSYWQIDDSNTLYTYCLALTHFRDSIVNTDRDPRIKCNDQTIRSLEGKQKSSQVSSTQQFLLVAGPN